MAESLNFQKQNLFTYFQDPWQFNDKGDIIDNILTLQPGGEGWVYLTEGINEDFRYFKCSVTFQCEGVTDSNNYQSNPTLYFKEVYKDAGGKPYRGKTRALCFNNFVHVEQYMEDYLKDETIFQSLNKPLYSLYCKVVNNTDFVLKIASIELYKSMDISESQANKIVETLNKQGQATVIIVNHNDDADKTLNGLEFQIAGGYTLKFKPYYYQGQLVSIETNAGQTVSVQHFIRDTDLTT